jgi:hypothetical protein
MRSPLAIVVIAAGMLVACDAQPTQPRQQLAPTEPSRNVLGPQWTVVQLLHRARFSER